MEVSEAIRSRRSVRKFRDQRVPRKDLIELVDYARLAPSGMNKQPLEFVIVDEP
ncbi:nitroreductase family protein, partial [Candidatus Bipolaricaulota bacterium]|nr:nitroreductase family protein [Candidatus Bipolaricaulota bacterium]MBS3792212.1 nitroreductase family protein [Candidatus Bipolaricaulota bacterium]